MYEFRNTSIDPGYHGGDFDMKTFQLNFSEEDYEYLKKKALEKHIPMADLIKQSLTRGAWLEKVLADPGKKLIIEEKDGTKTKIELL